MSDQGEHWLNRDRVYAYPRIVFALFVLVAAAWIGLSHDGVDRAGKPLGSDFVAFWAASHLALEGRAHDAYDLARMVAAERLAVPAGRTVVAWFYPPPFQFVILPLALLPYGIAFLSFMAATLGAYLAVLRRVVRRRDAVWLVAAFPGMWLNFAQGQNGFLTAAAAAAAILCLHRRPAQAALWVGLLVIKPHLAILFPLALVAAGAWRALVLATAFAAALLVLSVVVLGPATLEAWSGSMHLARHYLEVGALPWVKTPSVFSAARLAQMPVGWAYGMQAVAALAAAAAVWHVWRRSRSTALRGSALMAGTFLVSPYAFDYDLAWLAFPLAWLTHKALSDGWRRGDREVLVAAWILPMVMAPLAQATSVQIGPWVLAALLYVIVRRAGTTPMNPHP